MADENDKTNEKKEDVKEQKSENSEDVKESKSTDVKEKQSGNTVNDGKNNANNANNANSVTNVKAVVPQEDFDELTDRYKRILAEFENHKKRSAKERELLYNSVLGDIVEKFLPILDNLENAVKTETKDEEYKKGVELVLKQFKDVLKVQGVEEIPTVGQTFDPQLHDAVSSVQDESKGEKEIVQEYRKGYKIGHKIIRHSMVVVAN